MIWDALAWGHYYAQLLPFAVCVLLWALGRPATPDSRLLSAVLGFGFVADSVAMHLQPHTNWWVGYWVAPVQYGLLIAIVAQHRAVRHTALLGLAVLTVVSWTRGTWDAPETVVRVTGSAMVAFLIWGVPLLRQYRTAVVLLTAGTIPLLVGMVALPRTAPSWLWVWGALMILRISGYALMVWVISRPHLREVAHGRTSVLGRRGGGGGVPHGGHRAVVAAAKHPT